MYKSPLSECRFTVYVAGVGGKNAIFEAMWSTKPMATPLLRQLRLGATVSRGTLPLARQLAAPRSRRPQVQHARLPALTQRQPTLPAAPCPSMRAGVLLRTNCTDSYSTDARAQISREWRQAAVFQDRALLAPLRRRPRWRLRGASLLPARKVSTDMVLKTLAGGCT